MRSQEISLLHNEKENHLYHLLTAVPGQLQTSIDPIWGKYSLDLLSKTLQGKDAASNDKIRVSHESTGISSKKYFASHYRNYHEDCTDNSNKPRNSEQVGLPCKGPPVL